MNPEIVYDPNLHKELTEALREMERARQASLSPPSPEQGLQSYLTNPETQRALQQTIEKLFSFQRDHPPTALERLVVGGAAALGVQYGAPGAALAALAAEMLSGIVVKSNPRRRRRQ